MLPVHPLFGDQSPPYAHALAGFGHLETHTINGFRGYSRSLLTDTMADISGLVSTATSCITTLPSRLFVMVSGSKNCPFRGSIRQQARPLRKSRASAGSSPCFGSCSTFASASTVRHEGSHGCKYAKRAVRPSHCQTPLQSPLHTRSRNSV